MADNRMYLRCKCNKDEGVFLGKCMIGAGYYTNNFEHENTLIDRLNKYYDKHNDCMYDLDDFDEQYYIDYETHNRFNSRRQ